MQQNRRLLSATMTTLGALALVGASFTGTASATGSHGKGPADKGGKHQGWATEDTDGNDGGTPNNVVDRGDDRHPSGKDRSVEKGRSGNQGKATSDPDDDGRGPDRSNGGPDKPGGRGGVDKADQDGNNGCGNDDDFEDDNEGWCGRKPAKARPAPAPAPAKPATADKPKDHRKPATADKPKGRPTPAATPKPANGHSAAAITVDATCRSVSVTSTKDISHVEVWFADGTTKKFDGLTGRTWSKTFGKDVVKAKAKSGTSVRFDGAGTCGTPATTVPAPAAPAGGTTCPADMVDANGAAEGGCVTPAVLSNGLELCPGGTPMGVGCEVPMGAPAKVTPGDVLAGEEALEGEVLAASASAPATTPASPSFVQAAVGGVAGALAFTGGSVVTLLLAALVALAAGAAMLWADRRRNA